MENYPIDANRRESIKHGTEKFPFAIYTDRYLGSSYPRHWHDELEIGYAKKGRVAVEINQKAYVLEEGNGIFINNGTLHAVAGAGNMEAVFPNILYHASLVYGNSESVMYGKYLKQLLTRADISFLLLDQSVAWQGKILDFLKESIFAGQCREWGYEFRIRNMLTEIILLILSNCPDDCTMRETADEKDISSIRSMMDFIRGHYAEDIRLSDIAAAAAVGERECIRRFQAFMGKPPKQYVTEIRIRSAEKLLVSTTLSMREIGEMCGFQSSSYFSKVFRDFYGISPKEYRRMRSRGF